MTKSPRVPWYGWCTALLAIITSLQLIIVGVFADSALQLTKGLGSELPDYVKTLLPIASLTFVCPAVAAASFLVPMAPGLRRKFEGSKILIPAILIFVGWWLVTLAMVVATLSCFMMGQLTVGGS